MAIDTVFPRPTVKQVIFQIRFPNLFYLESKMGDLQMKIISKFPDSALLLRRQMFWAEGESLPTEEVANEFAKKIWQFTSPQGYQLHIHNDSFDINSQLHKSYQNPNAEHRFRDIIEFVLQSFREVTGVPYATRVGLRYIDECPIPRKDSATLSEYYNTTFPIERFPIERANSMQFTSEMTADGYSLRYVETLKQGTDNEYKLGLDFDGFGINIKMEDCLAFTDKLHVAIIEEFEKTIKEPVYRYMRGE